MWAAGASAWLTAGPLLGGALIALAGWRGIFFINLPVGLAGMWLAWRYARQTTLTPTRTLDLPGQVLAVLTLATLAAVTTASGQRGWLDLTVIAGFAAFVVLTSAFLLVELKSRAPMLPLTLFRIPAFTATSLAGLLVNVAAYGLIFVFSLYFKRIDHLSALWTGVAFAPMMLAILITNLVAAKVTSAVGARGVPRALKRQEQDAVQPQLSVELTSTMLGSVDKPKSGVASGVLNAMRQTGSVLGVALFGTLLSRAADYAAGMKVSFIIATAASVSPLSR